MTAKELATLVEEMRSAQTRYFREKTTALLDECVRLERAVDSAVRNVLYPPPRGLFDALETDEP